MTLLLFISASLFCAAICATIAGYMDYLDAQKIACPKCEANEKPIQKLGCYICSKCRVVLGYGKFK